MASDDINIFESIDNYLADDSIELSSNSNTQTTSNTSYQKHLDMLAGSDFDESSPSPIAKKRRSINKRSKKSKQVLNGSEDDDVVDKTANEIELASPVLADGQRLTRGTRKKAVETIETINAETALRQSLGSFDEENAEVMVKVYWESKLQKHPLRRHQTFSCLCEAIAEKNNCDAGSVVLTLNDRLINQTDTPDSIGYTIGKFIYARSMQHAFNKQSVSATSIELKIQSAVWKKPIHIRIEPKQKMKILVILCAEQLKRPANTLLFKFDGDLLDLEATPEDLDLEGGEVLDLRFIDL